MNTNYLSFTRNTTALAAQRAADLGGDTGIVAPPVSIPDLAGQFMDNLGDALGADLGVSASSSSASSPFGEVVPLEALRAAGVDPSHAPSWLVLIAAGLPFAVLTGAIWLRRRSWPGQVTRTG